MEKRVQKGNLYAQRGNKMKSIYLYYIPKNSFCQEGIKQNEKSNIAKIKY